MLDSVRTWIQLNRPSWRWMDRLPGLEIGDSRDEEHDDRQHELNERFAALEAEVAALRTEIDRVSERLDTNPCSRADAGPASPAASSRLALSLRQSRNKTIALLAPVRLDEWSPGGYVWDAIAIICLLVVAVPLWFIHLGSVPFGFHGDEAAIGLDARRILHQGWIGPYSGESGGTPAGPYYAAAVAIHFLGNTIFAARFASAFLDTLTVVLVYLLVRRNFGWGSAVVAGLLTAVSIWQLEFARLAFINSAWPFCVVAATVALCEAIRSRSSIWWASAGACWAAGLYAYPGHLLLLGVLGLFLLLYFAGLHGVAAVGAIAAGYAERDPVGAAAVAAGLVLLAANRQLRRREALGHVVAFALAFVAAAWPVIQFARHNREIYFRTGRGVSVFDDDEWASKHDLASRAWWLFGRYFEFWDRAIRHPVQDGIYGTGAAPMIPALFAALSIVGIWFAWRRRRQPLVLLGALIIALMPLAVATSNNFPLRRASVILPFAAMFAAAGVVELIRSTWRKGVLVRFGALFLIAALSFQITYRDLDGYFNETASSPGMYWTLAGDLVHSVQFMRSLPSGSYVYFYAERWPFDSGERLFLAPNVNGESRGAEFGEDSLALDPSRGQPVVILIGKYEALLPIFQMLHPNGSFELGPPVPGTNDEPSYIAFLPRPNHSASQTRGGGP